MLFYTWLGILSLVTSQTIYTATKTLSRQYGIDLSIHLSTDTSLLTLTLSYDVNYMGFVALGLNSYKMNNTYSIIFNDMNTTQIDEYTLGHHLLGTILSSPYKEHFLFYGLMIMVYH